MSTGAMYNHFPSKWAIAEELLEEQHARVQAVYENVAKALPSAFERLLCFSADLSELIVQDPAVRASIQLSTEPSLPLEAPVWRTWSMLADDLVNSAPTGIEALRSSDRLGSLTVILLVSAWLVSREQEEAALDSALHAVWSALAAGVATPEAGASAVASVASIFGK